MEHENYHVIAIPYKSFKEQMRLHNQFKKDYKVSREDGPDQEGILILTPKEKRRIKA
jgi:hypothetical protein